MLDILQGTPLWVYAVYLWICWYGIKATRGSRENHRSLMILPVVLVIWSLLSIEHSTLSIGCWLGGAAVGCLLAMAMFALGLGVRVRNLVTMGPKPFVHGLATTVWVASIAGVGVALTR